MKAKFGAIVVDGRGKIGGHVMSKSRSGAYMRTKVTGVNPQTSYQLAARNVLTSQSQAWRDLTDAQRLAWDAAVADYAKTDIFGDLRNPTGKNLFTRLNVNILAQGGTPISAPPALAPVGDITIGAITCTDTPTFTVAHTSVTAPDAVQVWVTAPVSAGKRFLKNRYRLLDTLTSFASPINIQAAYTARFGAQTAGLRVGVKLVPVSADGVTGIASEGTVIVS